MIKIYKQNAMGVIDFYYTEGLRKSMTPFLSDKECIDYMKDKFQIDVEIVKL